MNNTCMLNQNQQSILSLFCTDMKTKASWYRRRDRRPQRVNHSVADCNVVLRVMQSLDTPQSAFGEC